MNGALARIILRYAVGGMFFGSTAIGNQLALDPDIVMVVSGVLAALTELYYVVAKKVGWPL